ncbi:response regulator transcription factor [Apilactobacillus timberlakei]|uniref:DNA-binding response regulator n=1 Tax=Apilactobacillus timberlakei TaxID=2008380 RepID=A0ABY2YUS4_9LACO|nr:response regulator transcription factor [Apilactobacillus timberlakei]TPR14539.1 DNA-binding response regulator [Apilactobacillus timberlakei]TPR14582.1 DNA-binding response regulator [Apilactobacillus timberlakei]TPR15908.1 DNA-binding response regulator [Apilactobacillus timberlakei]TPR17309.1 DNA-binding response regulator [Apilactobacillus timberlakei]TPR18614.1 DNA-binding response regulator [Apilactobacillus timberlakei]
MNSILLITNNLKLSSKISHSAADKDLFINNLSNPDIDDLDLFLKKDKDAAIIYDLSVKDDFKTNLEFISKIRNNFSNPVIIISANYIEADEQKLFDLKIDDYIANILNENRILLRTINLIELYKRLISENFNNLKKYVYKDFEISLKHFQVKYLGEKMDLTPKEFNIFYYMVRHHDQVLSREQIFRGVWREDGNDTDLFISSRIVDMHVSHLRDKLKALPGNNVFIKTVRGFGYILN